MKENRRNHGQAKIKYSGEESTRDDCRRNASLGDALVFNNSDGCHAAMSAVSMTGQLVTLRGLCAGD